jgi:hypothetical protein
MRGDKLLRFGEQIAIKVIASLPRNRAMTARFASRPATSQDTSPNQSQTLASEYADSAQAQSTNSTLSRLRAILSSPG